MGLLDRLAARVAAEISKAPNLPAGAVATTYTPGQLAGIGQQYGGMPVNPATFGVPFSPGRPIIPSSINPVNPLTGRPEPRRYEYQVAQNTNVTETRPVSFKTLRASADQIDLLRRCVETVKSKVIALDWDIVLSQDSTEKITAESGKDYVRAMADARQKFTPEIDRVRTFWENPDRSNGLTWGDWLNMALEEILVLDAWAVWPQARVNGELFGFQILDGATIKPLLDDRGMRPLPPQAAYQQILYGFPRSEFSANDDDPGADGDFTTNDLAYMVRNRRTTSVFGYGPVERALPLADLYLRRQQWLRAEYTDGVTPELFFKSDINWGTNPDLLRAYENILNDDLAGQTEQRVRARLLPSGLDPFQPTGYAEKFSDAIDEFLIASICGHFGVQPTEIGYNPKAGLGGKGFESGKHENAEQLGALPLAQWIARQVTNISYTYLGMDRALEFKMMPPRRDDTLMSAQKTQIEVTSARKSINEARSDLGLPLLDTPQADMPILVAGSDVFLFSPDGIINASTVATAPTLDENMDPTGGAPVPAQASETPGNTVPGQKEATPPGNTDKAVAEMKAFMRFIRKNPTRSFEFGYVSPAYADTLNKFIEVGDCDSARWYAERYLGV